MAYYSKEEINKAKSIDLYSYLTEKEPDEIIPFARGTYITREHDSLKISNGMWYWFSKGIGGKSALDYLIKVREYSFIDAMKLVLGYEKEIPKYEIKKEEIKLQLPEKNINNDKVIYYLKARCIDETIIEELIDRDLIYESKDNHNAVFIGNDDNRIPKFACVRATNKSRYMHDVYGSNKAYSFKLTSDKSNTVHLFESVIDLMSYATLLKMNNYDYHNFNLLALAGVYQPSKNINESKIPISLALFLNNNQNVKKVVLHLDNDNAGRMASEGLSIALKRNYEVIDQPPKYGKDVNDYLCYIKKLNKERRNNYEL